ncbi:MAG: KEOPS complex kinase/ATPase Bud32 [archaeon]
MKPQLISQGAEAKIYLIENPRSSCENPRAKLSSNKHTLKSRTPKSYRHPQLDNQIRTRRTKSEAKILTKAFSIGANVPKVITQNKFDLEIQFIDGDRLSETLNSYPEKKQFQIMQQLGTQVALLHANNIIHGDLTTSNTILSSNQVYLIDFGLSFISTKTENKAVDIHLLKQALEAKHFQNHESLFKNFLKTYRNKEIIEHLKTVEKRGRYKH